jgi:hypothetical protein
MFTLRKLTFLLHINIAVTKYTPKSTSKHLHELPSAYTQKEPDYDNLETNLGRLIFGFVTTSLKGEGFL